MALDLSRRPDHRTLVGHKATFVQWASPWRSTFLAHTLGASRLAKAWCSLAWRRVSL
ncbi:MAG: hypothetical protein ACR2KC_03245 [Acidimicrobiales bacterium]